MDPWLNDPINSSSRIKCIYQTKQKKKDNYTILNEIENYAIELGLNKDIMRKYSNLSVNIFYSTIMNISLEFAVYIEYQRFNCFEWDGIIQSFNIAKLVRNAKNNQTSLNENQTYFDQQTTSLFENFIETAYNIKFEYFFGFANLKEFADKSQKNNQIANNIEKMYNFTQSTLRLLYLIPSLPRNEYPIINKNLQGIDISKKSDKWLQRNTHVTAGKSDKHIQIAALLGNKKHCLDLKRKTQLLDYWWLYPQFC